MKISRIYSRPNVIQEAKKSRWSVPRLGLSPDLHLDGGADVRGESGEHQPRQGQAGRGEPGARPPRREVSQGECPHPQGPSSRQSYLQVCIQSKSISKIKYKHVFRKGNWKIIVGHHEIPFIFPRVYEEPSKTGGWLVDGGSLGGRMLEMLLTFTDMVVGKEHDLGD